MHWNSSDCVSSNNDTLGLGDTDWSVFAQNVILMLHLKARRATAKSVPFLGPATSKALLQIARTYIERSFLVLAVTSCDAIVPRYYLVTAS